MQFSFGNKVTLLETGSDYFPALEKAIDQAAHEIYLETYIFTQDATGVRISQALQRAATRGVVTHVLVDGFGSKNLSKQFLDELLSAGVQLLMFRPEISIFEFKRSRLRRMHRKLVVIDGKIAFLGGINIVDDIDTPGEVPPRFDYAVMVEGPVVPEIHYAARRLWTVVAWTHFKRRWQVDLHQPRGKSVEVGTQRVALVVRDNFRHRDDIEKAYLNAIANARSEIIIANAYFLPGFEFRNALIKAAKRGIRVVLLLQGKVEYLLLHYATRSLYAHFIEANIEIYEYRRSFLHAKVAVIDRYWATVGSSNIDPFSLLLAREANLIIEDRDFALQLKSSLERAISEGGVRLAPEKWKKQPWILRIPASMSYGMVRFLTGVSGYGAGENPSGFPTR